MNKKLLLALLAIFLIAGSMVAVFGEDATLGDLKFEVPDDYKISETNDTTVVLKDGDKTIIISTEIIGDDAIDAFLAAKGYKLNETLSGNSTHTGTGLNGQYSYDESTFIKDKGFSVAYLLIKDNKPISVIGIDDDFDSDFDTGDYSKIENAVRDVASQIMLRK